MSKPPVVWFPLGDSSSRAGPVLSETGTPLHAAGMFGNGNYTTATSNYLSATYPYATYPNDNCMFDKWHIPDAGYNDNLGVQRFLFSIAIGASSTDFVQFWKNYFAGASNYWQFRIKVGNVNKVNYRFTPTTQYSASDKLHLRLVLASGAAIEEKARLYINGTRQIFFDDGGFDAAWSLSGSPSFYVGKQNTTLGSSTSGGVLDNLKIYDYIDETNFNDRWNERGRMQDSVVLV